MSILTEVNVYGDIILTIAREEDIYSYPFDEKSYCIKTPAKLKSNFKDFVLVHETPSLNFYANSIARSKCPAIIKGEVYGSIVVVVVNNKYIVLVKDRTKPYLTNPGGSFSTEHTHEECGIREVEEETGIVLKSTEKLTRCGGWKNDTIVYNTKFQSTTVLFYTRINLSQIQIDEVLKHQDHEIEKVVLAEIENIHQYQISDHHLIAINFVISKLFGLTESKLDIPSRFREFVLY